MLSFIIAIQELHKSVTRVKQGYVLGWLQDGRALFNKYCIYLFGKKLGKNDTCNIELNDTATLFSIIICSP